MRNIILLLLIVGWTTTVYAQNEQEKLEVTGIVTDAKNEPLVGVNVTAKNIPGFGAITDIDGRYKIKVPNYSYLVFSYVGFDKQEVFIKDKKSVNIVMIETKATVIDEVVITGTGAQKKLTMTGAVTTVDVSQLRTPTSSITNALVGNVAGIMARQTSGQPGSNFSEFWIRGISTFGAGNGALVLVDGFERDMNEINAEDIQDFSVLKDASATAIYGSRGANGVVLITTKRGKEGKTRVNAKVETSYNTRTRTPEFVDGPTYARMMNEALITRSQAPAYSESDLKLFDNGLDQDLFPNVNWMDLILKDGAPTYRANIDLTGGGTVARYFLSASYVNEGGMYETDHAMTDYNTNANYHRWNYRMNIDIDLTKTTLLKVGVAGSLDKQNLPGSQYGEIWNSLMGYNPIASPVQYSDGKWAAIGNGGQRNPWVLTTQQGYQETWKNKIQTTANLEQDFKFITPGLKFYGRFGFDTYTDNGDNRFKWPESWLAERQRTSDGELQFRRIETEQLMSGTMYSSGQRKEYLEAELHYNRQFGDHMAGAVLKYSQDKTTNTSHNGNSNSYDKIVQSIQNRHQGFAGRFTYGWKYRYFFDFNFGYNGSENFATGQQFGFFPAYSLAWNIAEEPIIKKHFKWMNMFKLRYSYGEVGNDKLMDGNNQIRFPYVPKFTEWNGKTDDMDNIGNLNGYYYGDIGTSNYYYPGLTYSRITSDIITWEIAKKHDLGLDFSLFDDKFNGSIDYFHEQRDGIYMKRNFLPYIIGLNHIGTSPYANVGSVLSEGFDGNIAYKQKLGEVGLTVRANMTYSKNKIKEYDEENSRYPYKMQYGFRVDQARGLIAEGLFKDYEEIRNRPKQGSDIMPGDIKYKDINGDGVIDSNDEVPIGATTRPNLVYGFGISVDWKGFDVNVHFQGAGKSSFFIDGFTVYPFRDKSWGNILTDVVGNYWSLGTNEDPNAKYPRLSYGNNSNNYRPSTYWLRNGSYIRLKNVEVGYTIPKQFVNRLHLDRVRLYLMGTNLLTFSSFKLWDPELGSSNGQQYPLSKTVTIGLTVGI
ncbi:TonB-linked outer membrane protein, SusC/RagA family [Bacteroides faecichinchillae]|uniref:TonB-linked outer membrane protein, SusC/RagA family n=1 Tax=Bacteroides faecichinchillae TaxID=871325 RepID=A0A1M5C566_9BACE|nr:TonB-dependent receptor [Bacteroides faecichinchillae]THG66372.1 TonB-dependent receptor [Bacteroides faecichinchillae]SHF49776.1 TonB-linked outer membrane protein, SusC/RagA family [Bacteroides faecichinchillae]